MYGLQLACTLFESASQPDEQCGLWVRPAVLYTRGWRDLPHTDRTHTKAFTQNARQNNNTRTDTLNSPFPVRIFNRV